MALKLIGMPPPPPVSHLLYADDILVMARADKKEAETFKRCFDIYCQWSRQEANGDKSNIYFSSSTGRRNRKEILDITGFKNMGGSFIYLGNSLVLGRNKSKEFGRLKERIHKQLEGWDRNLLSKTGKAVLIKSVIQSIPTYTMATFKVPSSICRDMDKLVKKF